MKKIFVLIILFVWIGNLSVFAFGQDNSIDLMFNYPFYKRPSAKIRTQSAKILYKELKNERKYLDFMIYGIYKQPKIFNQIITLCNNPNIKVRGIVDVNTRGQNDYPDTHKLKAKCKCIKTDFATRDEMQEYYDKQKKLGYLMHNKVFVFSSKVRTLETSIIPNKKDPEGSNLINGADDGIRTHAYRNHNPRS